MRSERREANEAAAARVAEAPGRKAKSVRQCSNDTRISLPVRGAYAHNAWQLKRGMRRRRRGASLGLIAKSAKKRASLRLQNDVRLQGAQSHLPRHRRGIVLCNVPVRRYFGSHVLRCSSKNARTCSGSSEPRNSTPTGSGSGLNTLSGVGALGGLVSMIFSCVDRLSLPVHASHQ
jgi:hypothetical protein